jgi:hypothetical protein
MWALILFGQIGRVNTDPLRDPEIIWGTAGIAAALFAGALLVYMADKWRKKAAAQVTDNSHELTEFRRMYESGQITQEEYVKLRDRVAQRVKTPPPAPVAATGTQQIPSAGNSTSPSSLPGPDQPTPPPDSSKPANPSSPA